VNQTSWLDAAGVDGVPALLWEEGERRFYKVWRNDTEGTRRPHLAVVPATEHPTPGSLDRLAHEYELKDLLDGAWAVRPLELVRGRGATALVLEYHDGTPLDRQLSRPEMPDDIGGFLRIAVGLAAALVRLHERGLVHKDIKPANILVDPAGDRVWLMGFGVASRLTRERQAPEPPELIAGTLSHMAPEQTGRINRSIDSRADLYSLGVTLYQAVTGQLPFTATTPLEWVHCHIARLPVAPNERVKHIPPQVSAIIMKLLAKTPEDRYQTAAGVERDLRRCFADWDRRRVVDEFPLAEQDRPDRLLIPERLYGRESETDALLAAFEDVVAGSAPSLVLVSGGAGIGKSSLVDELHKALVPRRGLFASGKFDQYKRDIPYSTVAQAFHGLVRPLLAKSDVELGSWRGALGEALGPNGQLMVDLVPELKLIIGEQAPVPELPPQDAKRRFQLVFRRFLAVFARPEHPLALFLDDLQWLDPATLDLLEDLLTHTDVRHVLLIGAYRDNEVASAHPLMRTLERIRNAGTPVRNIVLAPLAREDVSRFVADSLYCDRARAAPLAELAHEKTAGNPFFVIQFLSALVEEGLLTFDHGAARWTWDLERIHAKGYTDNVVDLMVGKLRRLPINAQDALRQLACRGVGGEFTLLTILEEDSREELHFGLQEGLRAGLVLRSGDYYCFVHDRVQEAAYSLIPEAQRAEFHLRIGRLLAAHTAPEKREEAVFEIVSQLNRGAALITSRDEKARLAELNLIAGRRAKASTAYVAALSYLVAGSSLLSHDEWEHRPDLMFALELQRAECEFLTGELAAAEARLTSLVSRTASSLDRAAVACLRIDLYTTLDRSDRAVDVCLDYLRHLGVEWTRHPTEAEARREYERMWSLLGPRQIEELIDLPLMSDPESVATLNVLARVLSPASFTDGNLLSLFLWRMVNLSLEHGHTDASCYAYVRLGTIAGPRFGNYEAGFRFGRLGYELVERRGLRKFQARTYLGFAVFIMSWIGHLRRPRDLIRQAFEAANSVGDLTQAAYAWPNLIANLLAAGDPLADVQREAERGLEYARNAHFGLVIDLIATQVALIRTLRGTTPTFGSFNDAQFDEAQLEDRLSDPRLVFAACWYWTRKLQARFLAGDYAAAVDASLNAQRLLWTSPSTLEWAEAHFYGALSHAASCDAANAVHREEHIRAVIVHHTQLIEWAKHCPDNFANRALLVGAELARLEGRVLEAERLYEEAIKAAREGEFVNTEAIALEVAAQFYAARGFDRIATAYLQDARSAYRRWGADGKVRQLDERHPHLREVAPRGDPTRTVETLVEQLDLAVVLQVLSAISGETDLEKLVTTVMRLGLEYAGADRGLLILPLGGTYQVEATAGGGDDGVTVALHEAPLTALDLPESVFQYVLRTGETVLLNDAALGGAFSSDDYLRQHHVRSVLCMPLLEQARPVGVLYLENRLTAGAFTPARMVLLKLLVSEAAISIENARLYRDLQEREARVRRLIDANIIGIFIWHADGRVFDANEELLRIIGYSEEELASGRLRWTDFTLLENRERDRRELEELRRGRGKVTATQRELLRKDGSRVPVLTGGTMFEGVSDEGVAFVVDLTELKRAEQALRERDRESRLILDTIPGLVATLKPSGEVDAVNQELVAFCGQALEAMKEWGTNGTVHPDDLPHMAPIFSQAIASGEPYDFEARIRRFDGVYRWLQVRGLPLRDSAGQIVRWYVLLADVDDRKRAEDAIDTARSELARVARVMSMSAFTASVAHEVSQPLSGIITNASTCLRMLKASPPNIDGARETAKRTIRDGNRASDVITRLRAMFSKREFALESMDLNEAMREVIALSLSDLQRNRVALQLELAERLPSVMGDRIQLQQVILNLLRNASEAMADINDRPRQLVVITEPEGDTGVRVTVRDAGVGLDRQSLDKLFDAFYTTKPGGMGIGLSVSRSIIESHHGRMWVEPNDGPGATFAFSIPARASAPPEYPG
jgi:PAS domain S-box-containing protein